MTAISELRELGVSNLEQRERELAEQLFRLRLQKSMGQQEAAGKLKDTRRDLARIKTLLREHQLGIEMPVSETKEVSDGN
ncbi:MAG: 50S ribosomal protein L29 [Acidobacteriota bacterium]|nr:50S ribosomal protein L29 [Acidobacteriota bacterium]